MLLINFLLTPRNAVFNGGYLKLGPKLTDTVALLCKESVGK